MVAACCDVDSLKRERFKRRVEAWQKSLNVAPRCDMYEFYEDVLDRKDIDVIEVATPDHWHALVAIHACQSGKDVYCQKPLAYTITEGLAVARAVRDNNRVFQIGSQQRSSKEFIILIFVLLSLLNPNRTRSCGGHGAGIRKPETDIQPIGGLICSILHRRPSVWTDPVQ